MVQLTARLRRDERGAVAVVTAVLMVALILLAAAVVDLGYARAERRQSQNSADAASLAAANALFPTAPSTTCSQGPTAPPCFAQAVAVAKSFAERNTQRGALDWANCSASSLGYVPAGSTPCISFDDQDAPKQVKVVMPTYASPSFFGAIAGVRSIPVSSLAIAQIGEAFKCTLCVLANLDTNNSDFTVNGGSIAVNGYVSVSPSGNSTWSSLGNWYVKGWAGNKGGASPSPKPINGFGDPLLGQVPSTTPSATALKDPCADGPGTYSDVSIGNKDTCTLKAGVYVITGTWSLGNKSLLTAESAGVTLYVTGTKGNLDFKNGDVSFNASSTGVFKGYSIIFDPTTTSGSNSVSLQGNGSVDLVKGIVYAPKAQLNFNGNSSFTFDGGPIVIGGISSVGNKSGIVVSNAQDTLLYRNTQGLVQ